MTATKPAGTAPTDRTTSIAAQIRGAMDPILAADDAAALAKEAADAAKGETVNVRQGILGSLASLAHDGDWTPSDVVNGLTHMLAGQNDDRTKKTLSTFASEAKLAMHPTVRGFFQEFVDLRNEAWDAETAALKADKAAPQPLRRTFKRAYHMLKEMLLAGTKPAPEGVNPDGIGLCPPDAEGLVAWANARSPDIDPDKALKELTALKQKLGAICDQFPEVDLQMALDSLAKTITSGKKGLVIARCETTGEEVPAEYRSTVVPVAKAKGPRFGKAASTTVAAPAAAAVVQAPNDDADVGGVTPDEGVGAVDIDQLLAA